MAGRGDMHEQVQTTMQEAQWPREVEDEVVGVGWIQDVAEGGALHEVHSDRRDSDVGKPEDEWIGDLRGRMTDVFTSAASVRVDDIFFLSRRNSIIFSCLL